MAFSTIGRSRWLWATPLLLPLAVAAFTWNNHLASETVQVAHGVEFLDGDVSGYSFDQIEDVVKTRAAELHATPVTVDLGTEEIVLNAADLGFSYDTAGTLDDLLAARHGATIWSQFKGWITTPFSTVNVKELVQFDEDQARAVLEGEDFVLQPTQEPSIVAGGSFAVIPGVAGEGIDVNDALALLGASDVAAGPLTLEPDHLVLEPSVTADAARQAADRLNEITATGLVALAGAETGKLTPAQLRSHFDVVVKDGSVNTSIDVESLHSGIEAAFPNPIGEFVRPVLEVVDGGISVVRTGSAPDVCCNSEATEEIAERILAEDSRTFRLLTRPAEDETLLAWADGSLIVEEVATFTTFHSCCENRVVNIQTIADRMTGYYMLPGETLSFNEYVGPRTRAKGYLPAGAIRSGHLTDEVGGGISQFITTMFNAAYFGGLDLDEYQTHSVYFPRYPFGREATMSIPGPDLVLTNATDHPVLIWPTYTSTSITVTLYSTKNVEVEELGQKVFRRNQCRHVQTERQRTFSDGRVEVDVIIANYRPGDGIDCNGNPIPEP